MKTVKNDVLRRFFEELRFAPAQQKEKELAAAQELRDIADRQREYPFEFICFRITGYRLKSGASEEIIPGDELINDLGCFIRDMSRQLQLRATGYSEKVFTVEHLAETFSVSAKTIHRWRSRGLRGRMFIFDDEKRRLGFPDSAVKRFLDSNPELIANGRQFRRLTAPEKDRIIEQARTLAAAGWTSRNRIIKELASRSGRARETIRTLLVEYDKSIKHKSIFRKSSGRVRSRDIRQIFKLHKEGVPVAELMQKYDRSRSSIYRIINKYRATRLLDGKLSFIDSADFHDPQKANHILSPDKTPLPPAASWGKKALLNRAQETELFRRYNYLKFLACTELTGLNPDRCAGRYLRRIESYLEQAEAIKKLIIEANLGLVASIAGKHHVAGSPLADLISEGNFSLMRAVEKFDYTRGYRFSTYATWAISKDFARRIPEEARRPDRQAGGDMSNIQQNMRIADNVDFAAIDRAHHSLDQVIRDNLSDRQQYIIRNHYALQPSPTRSKPKTLKEIGRELNLSSERVRQIELEALQKLRQNLSAEEFDLLTG